MANIALRRFASGEMSPEMYAATNTESYLTGLRTLRNAYVMRQGGVQSRPGTAYCGTTKSNGAVRLYGVVFDTDAAYVLEYGDSYVRFWKDGALVEATVTGAWADVTAYTAGIVVSETGVNYVCILAHTSSAALNRPGIGSAWQTYWYALTGTTYELPTPYTIAADLGDISFQYTYNVVRTVHPDFARRTLTRVSNNVWTIATTEDVDSLDPVTGLATTATPGTAVEWQVTAYQSTTDVESLAPTSVGGDTVPGGLDVFTLSWNAVTGATSYRLYKSVGGSVFGFFAETTALQYVDTGEDSVDYTRTPPTTLATLDSAGNYPSVIAAYQQRVILAGSANEPDVVRASRTGSPDDFTVSDPLRDDDALEWRQVGRRLNRVRHFSEVAQRLVQFSDVGESIIVGDTDGILRPGEVNPRQFSENGAAKIPPLVINDSALYVQARGAIVRDIAPIEANGFQGSDLTLMAAHLVDGYQLVDWCYQQTPNSVVWASRNDGTLLSLTYVRELGVLGWATHDTDGLFERVVCIPEGTRDVVYAVVSRTVNGVAVRYVERFTDRLADTPALVDAGVSLTAGSAVDGVELLRAGFGTWTARTTADLEIRSIAFGNDVAVAVSGEQSASGVFRSTDGISWTQVAAGAATHYWYRVIWVETLALFVAVGDKNLDNLQIIMTSPDGLTWTVRTASFTDLDASLTVVHAPSLTRLVASDSNGSHVLLSTDAVTWTETATTGLAGGLSGIAWSPTLALFCGVVEATQVVYTSANGTAWAAVTLPGALGALWETGVDAVWTDDRFVVPVPNDGNGGSGILTSLNGVAWTYTALTGSAVGVAVSSAGWNATDAVLLLTTGPGQAAGTTAVYTTDFTAFSVTTIVSSQAVTPCWASGFSRFLVGNLQVAASTARIQDATYAPTARVLGLDWLEGESVSAVSGTTVAASPNNPAYTTVPVSGGIAAFPAGADYTTLVIGLPFVTDIQTLDIDAVATTIKNRAQFSGGIIAWVRDTGAFWAGPTAPTSPTAITTLERIIPQDENWDSATVQASGTVAGVTLATRNDNGRIFIRQVDPLPLTILGLAPQGTFGGTR